MNALVGGPRDPLQEPSFLMWCELLLALGSEDLQEGLGIKAPLFQS
jgi:hypothetical protein